MAAAAAEPNRGGRLASCPNCGSKATARGQLMCLECGTRMGLVFRRPSSWKAPLAIIVAVVVVLALVALLAFSAISDNADDEVGTAANYADTAGQVSPT